jgi:hypothetical protein
LTFGTAVFVGGFGSGARLFSSLFGCSRFAFFCSAFFSSFFCSFGGAFRLAGVVVFSLAGVCSDATAGAGEGEVCGRCSSEALEAACVSALSSFPPLRFLAGGGGDAAEMARLRFCVLSAPSLAAARMFCKDINTYRILD